MTWSPPALAMLGCLVAAAPSGAAESEPPDRFGVAASVNGPLSMMGFPMVGAGVDLAGRVRILDWMSIEPHVDGVLAGFVSIGAVSGQVGAPIVFEAAFDDGWRRHIGVGPWLSISRLVGHIDGENPPMMHVGAEVVGGAGVPLTEWLEVRAQLRGTFGVGGPPLPLTFGVAPSAGLMLTF